MMPVATLVVDDEPPARSRIVRLLEHDPTVRIVGVHESPRAALEAARVEAVDLLLLDVRMPELDGFELLTALREAGVEPLVIVISAYSDRAHHAFDVGAVDYVLKPFDDARFALAMQRAKEALQTRDAGQSQPRQATAEGLPRLPSRLLITDRGQVSVIHLKEIEYIQAAAKYVAVHVAGRAHMLRQPISMLERRLDPSMFARIHRSTIVNVEYISEIHPLFHGDCEVVLRRGTRLTLSRRFKDRLDSFLGS